MAYGDCFSTTGLFFYYYFCLSACLVHFSSALTNSTEWTKCTRGRCRVINNRGGLDPRKNLLYAHAFHIVIVIVSSFSTDFLYTVKRTTDLSINRISFDYWYSSTHSCRPQDYDIYDLKYWKRERGTINLNRNKQEKHVSVGWGRMASGRSRKHSRRCVKTS